MLILISYTMKGQVLRCFEEYYTYRHVPIMLLKLPNALGKCSRILPVSYAHNYALHES